MTVAITSPAKAGRLPPSRGLVDFFVYLLLIGLSVLFSFAFFWIGQVIRTGSVGCLIQFPLSVLASVFVTDFIALNFLYEKTGSTYSIAVMFHVIVSSVICVISLGILSGRASDA